MDDAPEPRTERFILPMTTSQLVAATGFDRRGRDIDSDDLATLAVAGADALHVETDTEEGVVVRLAFGADHDALRRAIAEIGGLPDLPMAA